MGRSDTRSYPITTGVSKQLLPIYDKPLIARLGLQRSGCAYRHSLWIKNEYGQYLLYVIDELKEEVTSTYILSKTK